MKDYLFSNHNAKKFLIILIAIEIFFVIMHFIDVIFGQQVWIIHNMFALNRDISLPALFSSIQLFFVGIVWFMIASGSRQQSLPSRIFLSLLGSGFIFLSIDEAIRIHENITLILKHIEWIPRFKGDHGIWIPIYLSLILIFFLITYKNFLAIWKQFRHEAILMVTGVVIFLAGAVGMEIIAYQFLMDSSSSPLLSLLWYVEVAVEEFFEMIGISLILYGVVLLYNVRNVKESRDYPNSG